MAANVTVIGRTTRVRGRVTGAVDLEVQGFVEGEIAVGGDVTVDSPGIVGAGIRARRLIVRGAVKGDLVGDESILLESGARVVGDLRAPRVAIAQGDNQRFNAVKVLEFAQRGRGQPPHFNVVVGNRLAQRFQGPGVRKFAKLFGRLAAVGNVLRFKPMLSQPEHDITRFIHRAALVVTPSRTFPVAVLAEGRLIPACAKPL